MKRWTVFFLAVVVTSALLLPSAHAEPKKKLYNNSSEQVFKAALRTARERHVVTYVDEKTLMFTFETGRSFTSEGFVANASVEPEGEDKATLIINVQSKKGFSWGAGDRMAEKFYLKVADELAGDPHQKSAIKGPENAVVVPDAKAVPPEPSMTKPADAASPAMAADKGKISVSSLPDSADIEIDGSFVGNTPSDVQVAEGDHTVTVKKAGFKDWERKMKVTAGSSVHLNAELEKVTAQ